MAMLDANMLFMGSYSSGNLQGQLITSLGTTVGQGVVDTAPSQQSANQTGDTGAGEAFNILIQIKNTLTSGGAATVRFQLVQADDAALSVNVNVLAQTDDFPYTVLTAGQFVALTSNPAGGVNPPRRYMGMRVVIAGAVLTNGVGQFVAAAAKDVMNQSLQPIYKSGIVFQ